MLCRSGVCCIDVGLGGGLSGVNETCDIVCMAALSSILRGYGRFGQENRFSWVYESSSMGLCFS